MAQELYDGLGNRWTHMAKYSEDQARDEHGRWSGSAEHLEVAAKHAHAVTELGSHALSASRESEPKVAAAYRLAATHHAIAANAHISAVTGKPRSPVGGQYAHNKSEEAYELSGHALDKFPPTKTGMGNLGRFANWHRGKGYV